MAIAARAPARASRVHNHVNASPRFFSISASFADRGKELLHNGKRRPIQSCTVFPPGKQIAQKIIRNRFLLHNLKLVTYFNI